MSLSSVFNIAGSGMSAQTTRLNTVASNIANAETVSSSIDQNTVDAQLEQSNYAENAVGFQASFTLLNSKFKGLVSALRGE